MVHAFMDKGIIFSNFVFLANLKMLIFQPEKIFDMINRQFPSRKLPDLCNSAQNFLFLVAEPH